MSMPADRIERFLRDNPSGPLWVTVGYASAFGLVWLNERTAGRPANLLIGDTRTGFSNHTETDRLAAIRFLQRPDVSVRNWYHKRGGYRMAHAKTWIVEPDPLFGISGAVLVGSANLTRQGLLHNVEMLTLAAPEEHERLFAEMHQLMGESWPIENQLLRRLGAAGAFRPGLGNRTGGDFTNLMVPEPGPFLFLLTNAKEIRVLTAEGRDATFGVEGFLATPVQANLNYCGHYP